MAHRLAACLRELADELECSEQVAGGTFEGARQKLQLAIATCWEVRPLPSACMALRDFLKESALKLDVEIKIVKPNGESSFVGMILCKGVAEAVVKYRGEFPSIALREECNYVFADRLGFGDVVSPCIAFDLSLCESTDFTDLTVLDVLRKHTSIWATQEHCSKTWPTNMWVTVERCIRVVPEGESPSALGKRFANFFGSVDLLQAYAATPSGPDCGVEALLRDTYTRKEPTDADFLGLISGLDLENVHRLCMLACITMQRDGGPSNLMLRQKAGSNSNGIFQLVCIDSTRVLHAFPSGMLKLFDGTIDQFTYWFPVCLELPQASEVIHASVASAVLSLDADDVERFLTELLSVPGASVFRSRSEAVAASDRLRHLQRLLGEGQELTARELCFRVLPTWEVDYWAPSRRELIPLHDLEVHWQKGGSAQEWEERWSWPHQNEDVTGKIPQARVTVKDFF